jgi:hypothetical protein
MSTGGVNDAVFPGSAAHLSASHQSRAHPIADALTYLITNTIQIHRQVTGGVCKAFERQAASRLSLG